MKQSIHAEGIAIGLKMRYRCDLLLPQDRSVFVFG